MSTVDASANAKVRSNGHHRWPHVDLVALIRESGCTLREKGPGKWVGDHAPKHASKSGECLVVWPDRGRWHCTSCGLGGDAAAWIAHLEDCDYAEACRRLVARFGPAPADAEGEASRAERESQAKQLVRLALATTELFHTPAGEAFASVPVGDHLETWPLRSRAARQWLARRAFDRTGRVPGSQALADALTLLEGHALFAGAERPVHVRLAGHDGAIYLDLGDGCWRVAAITAQGWRVIPAKAAPVRFWRPRGMLPLPAPVPGGSLAELDPFLNLATESDRRLVLGFLLGALRPRGPYPILVVHGEQGSGKSTLARVLRELVDPNALALRAEPRSIDDLMIAAANGWVQVYDNLSSLPQWMSDAFCRLSTGGGLAKRELYSDRDETLLDAQRPVIINGIEELATRPDLLDRALIVYLPRLTDDHRLPEAVFWHAFDRARPRLLGALLDTVAVGLRNLDRVRLDRPPRLADFAIWVTACEPALPWPAGGFLDAYAGNRESAHELALEASPIVEPLRQLVREAGGEWTGTATELLDDLTRRLTGGDGHRLPRGWPGNGRALSNALRRLSPNLRAVGLAVEFSRTPGRDSRRLVTITAMSPEPSPPRPTPTRTPTTPTAEENAEVASPASHQVQRCDASGSDATQPEVTCDANHSRVQIQRDACDARDANSVPCSSPVAVADWDSNADPDADRCVAPGCTATIDAFGPDGLGYCAHHLPPPPPSPSDHPDAAESPENPESGETPASGGAGAPSVRTGPSLPSWELIDDAATVRGVLPELLRQPVLGLDCETTGLDPLTSHLRLVQLSTPERAYLIDCFRVDPRVLAPLFDDPRRGPVLVGHNLKFDLRFLWAAGLEPPHGARLFDTMLADQLVRGCAPPRSLKELAAEVLGLELDKSFQESDWSGALSPGMLRYAARDAAVLLPLYERLQKRLASLELTRVAEVEMRALPAVTWLEQTGCPFDFAGWSELAEAAERERDRLAMDLSQLAGPGAAVSWDSVPQALTTLRAAGVDVPDTREETLARHADHPLVALLVRYREAAKRAGTYGKDWLRYASPATGRLHPDWRQIGAASGRMACKSPNLQNLPRDPAYRACVRPANGRVLVKADYTQIELRIAAELAGERRMIDAFRRGEDLHRLTAALVRGTRPEDVTKDDRQLAKAVNFGLLYGMGARAFAAHARTAYGLRLSEGEVEALRETFFAAYPGLRRWHRAQPDGPLTTRTLLGRKRFGVERFTEKLNTPVQGSGADGLKAALALVWETRERCPTARPIVVVHDEVVLECPADAGEAVRDWLVQCMRQGMEAVLRQVPVVVEATIGRDWSGASSRVSGSESAIGEAPRGR